MPVQIEAREAYAMYGLDYIFDAIYYFIADLMDLVLWFIYNLPYGAFD